MTINNLKKLGRDGFLFLPFFLIPQWPIQLLKMFRPVKVVVIDGLKISLRYETDSYHAMLIRMSTFSISINTLFPFKQNIFCAIYFYFERVKFIETAELFCILDVTTMFQQIHSSAFIRLITHKEGGKDLISLSKWCQVNGC